METRSFATQVNLEHRGEKVSRIYGVASVAYNGDSATEAHLYDNVYERFMPNAFTSWLRSKPTILASVNHNLDKIIGKTPKTMQVEYDGKQLEYDIKPANTTATRDAIADIEAGNCEGSSISFRAVKTRWLKDGDRDIREIHEAEVTEMGPATIPYYSGTGEPQLRSMEHRSALQKERDDSFETERLLLKIEKITSGMNR